ncbi:MAG TPA: hypothetical protein VF773_07560 [Verrucomicrobiae bacterium]
MSLLLAVLPVEGHRITVEQADTCSSCGCCVQPNANPSPARNAPAVSRTLEVERQEQTDVDPVIAGPVQSTEIPLSYSDAAHLRIPSVALFQRHCSLLI